MGAAGGYRHKRPPPLSAESPVAVHVLRARLLDALMVLRIVVRDAGLAADADLRDARAATIDLVDALADEVDRVRNTLCQR